MSRLSIKLKGLKMNSISDVEEYLSLENYTSFNIKVFDLLKSLKGEAVSKGDEQRANYIWCLETIAKIKSSYLGAISDIKKRKQLDAWIAFDRCCIEASFLEEHFELSDSKYRINYIIQLTKKFQALFPYKLFMSRETIEKDFTCSICGSRMGLRNNCCHAVGNIYYGEMCCREINSVEFLAIALVSNPVDKYTVPQIEGQEYDYRVIDYIVDYLDSPYQLWDYKKEQIIWRYKEDEMFKHLGRNDVCACGSGKKFKKCCYKKEGKESEHFKFTLNQI